MLQVTCLLCYFSVLFHLLLIMTSSGTLKTSSKAIPNSNSSSSLGIVATTSDSSSSQQFLADADVQRVAQAVARIIAPSVQNPISTVGTGSSSINES